MVQDGARWCKMVQDGARWCKMVQEGARWCKMVQDGARRCMRVQYGATCWCLLRFWNWCLVEIMKMKFDQDFCLNLWYELNPRVRCAFGNVFLLFFILYFPIPIRDELPPFVNHMGGLQAMRWHLKRFLNNSIWWIYCLFRSALHGGHCYRKWKLIAWHNFSLIWDVCTRREGGGLKMMYIAYLWKVK